MQIKIITATGNTTGTLEGNSIFTEKFRAEVTGIKENNWSSNGKEYDTPEEAQKWLNDLSTRWYGYDLSRIVPVSTPQRQPVDFNTQTIYQNFRSK